MGDLRADQLQQLKRQFGEALQIEDAGHNLRFTVPAGILVHFVRSLRSNLLAGPHLFCDLFGIERETAFEVVYRFSMVEESRLVTIVTALDDDDPEVATLSEFYPGALWPERELMEMFGVTVQGHPDPRNLLLPEGWEGYPLRKDYAYPAQHPLLAPDPLREDPAGQLAASADEAPSTDDGSGEGDQ